MYPDELLTHFGWLKLDNAKDVEWAINYLVQKGLHPTRNVTDRNTQFLTFLAFDIESGINRDRCALVLDKMKRAYSSRQRRHDPDKVSVTYLMSKKAKAALEKLVAKDSKEIYELENLILASEAFRRDCRDELRRKRQELEGRLERREEALAQKYQSEALVKENKGLRLALDRAQIEATRNGNLYKAELRRAVELEVSAGIQHRMVVVPLNEEEQQEVEKRYIDRLKPVKSGDYH